ncbi:T-lymphocyte activation antigen CD80 isoform X3 [Labrus mixtus]|uniref:T-lymphocyte activation antigen CD80 isoform X3 n=1 Tax=Labrus mixtus TaxID=508554 RepID=UPI0029C02424|nr:T-lymphocyte activation antigen CD80 isoform X3 [Labrus mixtus]
MASAGLLLLTLAVLNSAGSSQTFVKIHCKTQNIGQCDQESRLDCVIHYSEGDVEDAENAEILAVIWRKEGVKESVLKYENGNLTSLPGYSFAEPSWNNKNVNVSLLIHKTAVKDEGVYTCDVFTDSGYNTNHTRLNVTAKYGVPTIQPQPQDIDLNTDGSLTCRSTGYPKGRLSWFDKDNKPWLEQPKVEVLTTESGLFILSSTLNIQRGSAFSQYTCKVFNARGDKEAEKSFTVQDKPSIGGLGQDAKDTKDSNMILATKIVAPVLVVGSLIVGLLVLLLYKRRSQRDDQETEGDVQESLTTEMGQDTKDSNMILATKIVVPVLVVGFLIVGLLVFLLYRRRSQHEYHERECILVYLTFSHLNFKSLEIQNGINILKPMSFCTRGGCWTLSCILDFANALL